MSIFNSEKKHSSVVLIDIDSSSVGAALVHIENSTAPTIYFTVRKKSEPREHENASEAMLRTLEEIAEILVSKGAPALRQETGSGHIDRVLISVGAPWQKASIRIEAISEAKPFSFSHALLFEVMRNQGNPPEGYINSGEKLISTLLNGYETPKPFGKKATRADMIILSSLIDKRVALAIEKTIRKTYHTHALTLTAFASVAYSAFKNIFPHEKDFLVFEVSGTATDIAFIKRGLLVDVATIPSGIHDLASKERNAERTWLSTIQSVLQSASTRHALPRTLFLVADDASREYVRGLLDSSSMRSLWITEDPLRVISILPAHFSQFVRTRGAAAGDVYLALLALYSQHEFLK